MSFISNSFCTPNALVDVALRELDGNALKCYLVIARKTTGWNKQVDRISNSQMRELSGIKDERTVNRACEKLAQIGLVVIHKKRGQMNEYELVQNEELFTQLTTRKPPTSVVPPTKNVPTLNEGGLPTSVAGDHPHPLQVTTPIGCGSTKDTITKTTITKDTNKKQEISTPKNPQPKKTEKQNKFDAIVELKNLGVDDQVASDFLALRKLRKSTLTKTGLSGLVREADKAKISLNDAITICCERNWIGFRADWDWQPDKSKNTVGFDRNQDDLPHFETKVDF